MTWAGGQGGDSDASPAGSGRGGYFVRHLELEAESPNKPPEDPRARLVSGAEDGRHLRDDDDDDLPAPPAAALADIRVGPRARASAASSPVRLTPAAPAPAVAVAAASPARHGRAVSEDRPAAPAMAVLTPKSTPARGGGDKGGSVVAAAVAGSPGRAGDAGRAGWERESGRREREATREAVTQARSEGCLHGVHIPRAA